MGDSMEAWFDTITRVAIIVINSMALVIVFVGTVEAFVRGFLAILRPSPLDDRFRIVWVRYARWLVAGLTFQLGADIIETAIAPGWVDIGRLAAVAVIRTFLNFFLERDLTDVSERK
jgi:uncharacterized membrane protein